MGKYCRQHIGKTFNEGKLIVVDGGDKRHYVKVKCKACAEDSELFGDGVFDTTAQSLHRGSIPCGCSKAVNWTLDQHRILINRKIVKEKLPIRFIGFIEDGKRVGLTSIRLYCEESKSEYTISRVVLFYKGFGNSGNCENIDKRLSEYHKLNPKYEVWNTGNANSYGNMICGFHCSVCESKGYESLFTVDASSLLNKGQIPCYCAPKIARLTGSHVTQISKEKLAKTGLTGIQVIGSVNKTGKWYTVFQCEIHGIYSRWFSNLDRVGCHCTKCEPPSNGYDKTKRGYFYLLSIDTPSGIVIGYGITNKLSTRITTHKRNLKSIGATITNIQVFEGSGTAVLAVENAIKSLHTTGLIDCEGFRRESISIDRKEEVLEKCKKLKELDNTDKLI